MHIVPYAVELQGIVMTREPVVEVRITGHDAETLVPRPLRSHIMLASQQRTIARTKK
jgi:hypothetical protein